MCVAISSTQIKKSKWKYSGRYLHGTELDSPANIGVWRWRFEPHCLPVGRLQVLQKVLFENCQFFVTLLGFLISSQESCNTLPQSGQTHFHHPSEFSPQRRRVDLE